MSAEATPTRGAGMFDSIDHTLHQRSRPAAVGNFGLELGWMTVQSTAAQGSDLLRRMVVALGGG